ncbi:MAG: hypothetical protein M0Z99_22455 [Betaproteobacteria bacterium]|nr:hypothetical protein [Betaproteobacteria bacterium]
MTPTPEIEPTVYMVDSRANLIIEQGATRLVFNPVGALELIKFIERTGYQAHANSLVKGAEK